jgi:hypothetical protein
LFPVDTSSVLGDIAVFETYERLCAVISGSEQATSGRELDQEIDAFRTWYKFFSGSTYGCAM